jgi:aminopeptidase N
MASQIAVGLYPNLQSPRLVLARTDEWLAANDAEPALRRLVIEGRDAVARAEKAQECDRTLD